MNYRISATTLESWRLFNEVSWMTADKMAEAIQRRTVSTLVMRRGSAFGEILEAPQLYDQGEFYEHQAVMFRREDIAAAIALQPEGAIFEEKHVIENFADLPVDLVVKCDWMKGSVIGETKTCWSSFNIDKYQKSMQWRTYLAGFECQVCQYNVFEMSVKKTEGIVLKDIHSFPCFAYPDMRLDVINSIKGLIAWCEREGLADDLRRSSENKPEEQAA